MSPSPHFSLGYLFSVMCRISSHVLVTRSSLILCVAIVFNHLMTKIVFGKYSLNVVEFMILPSMASIF